MNPDRDHGLKTGDKIDMVLNAHVVGAKRVTVALSYESYLGQGIAEFFVPGRYFNTATGPVGHFAGHSFDCEVKVATFTVGDRDELGRLVLTREGCSDVQ